MKKLPCQLELYVKKYQNWKGIEGLKRAEQIEEQLRLRLARKPKKRDFDDIGLNNAWMALYRHRKKTKEAREHKGDLEKIYTDEIRSLLVLTENHKLVETIFEDIIKKIGRERTNKILTAINKRLFS